MLNLQILLEYKDVVQALTKAVERALIMTTSFIETEFRERLSVRYFSLKQLRKLGHPYAKKHYRGLTFSPSELERFAISLKYRRGYAGVPLSVINRQSGELESNLKKEIILNTPGPLYGRVYIDTNAVRYARYVFFGTSILIPRPIHLLVKSEIETNVRAYFKRLVTTYFKRELRTVKKKLLQSGLTNRNA